MATIHDHTNLQNRILIEITRRWPQLIAMKFDAGTARALHDPERVFQYGNIGFPDILVLAWGERFLLFEAKTGNARMNKAQKYFAIRVQDVGSEVKIVRTVEDAIAAIEEKRRVWKV